MLKIKNRGKKLQDPHPWQCRANKTRSGLIFRVFANNNPYLYQTFLGSSLLPVGSYDQFSLVCGCPHSVTQRLGGHLRKQPPRDRPSTALRRAGPPHTAPPGRRGAGWRRRRTPASAPERWGWGRGRAGVRTGPATGRPAPAPRRANKAKHGGWRRGSPMRHKDGHWDSEFGGGVEAYLTWPMLF